MEQKQTHKPHVSWQGYYSLPSTLQSIPFRRGVDLYGQVAYKESLPWFQQAAQNGCQPAYLFLDLLRQKGFRISESTEELAVIYYDSLKLVVADLAKLTDPNIVFDLGLYYLAINHYAKAMECLHRAAMLGHTEAQYHLSVRLTAESTKKLKLEDFIFPGENARLSTGDWRDDAGAQYQLGLLYKHGAFKEPGLENQSYYDELAEEYFKRAAANRLKRTKVKPRRLKATQDQQINVDSPAPSQKDPLIEVPQDVKPQVVAEQIPVKDVQMQPVVAPVKMPWTQVVGRKAPPPPEPPKITTVEATPLVTAQPHVTPHAKSKEIHASSIQSKNNPPPVNVAPVMPSWAQRLGSKSSIQQLSQAIEGVGRVGSTLNVSIVAEGPSALDREQLQPGSVTDSPKKNPKLDEVAVEAALLPAVQTLTTSIDESPVVAQQQEKPISENTGVLSTTPDDTIPPSNPSSATAKISAKKAAKKPTVKSQQPGQKDFELGLKFLNERKFPQALESFKQSSAADPSYRIADIFICKLYVERPEGIDSNPEELEAYRQQAKGNKDWFMGFKRQGTNKHCYLGFYYQFVEEKLEEAITWLTKAAACHHAPASDHMKQYDTEIRACRRAKAMREDKDKQILTVEAKDRTPVFAAGVEPVTEQKAQGMTSSLSPEELAEQTVKKAINCLALSQFKDARESLERVAGPAYPQAYLYLGYIYQMGWGVAKDAIQAGAYYEEARQYEDWFKQNNDDPRWQFYSSLYHFWVDINHNEAIRKLSFAAKKDDAEAQNYLAICYADGDKGVNQDISQAEVWFRRSMESGFLKARSCLIQEYLKREGCEVALKALLDEGVRQTDPLACSKFALLAFKAALEDKDALVECVNLFRIAAGKGDMLACYHFGECYLKGYGIEQDFSKAIEYFTMAAKQGNVDAQYRLGSCYFNGEGVLKKLEDAKYWLELAVAQEHKHASRLLLECEAEMNAQQKDGSEHKQTPAKNCMEQFIVQSDDPQQGSTKRENKYTATQVSSKASIKINQSSNSNSFHKPSAEASSRIKIINQEQNKQQVAKL